MRNALKFFFRFFELFFILIFFLAVIFHKLVSYGIDQGTGQLAIVWNARPVDDVMKDASVSDSVKTKLNLIEEIKKFAIDSLGLKPSENYSTLYNQHGKPVLWVLTAAEKYKMKSFEWWFPVVGTVGYKGFFNFEKGKREEQKLIDGGYDTDYGPTSAWSTLGWFRDPILSNVLNRTDGQLAELFIHEMTHATLYVKSSVDFNENLASFIGEEGAIQFFKFKYGDSTTAMTDYLNGKEDYDLFSNQMLIGLQKLDSLYKTFTEHTIVTEKEMQKKKIIREIISSLDTVSFYKKERYKNYFSVEHLPNNAFFLSFQRYDSKKDEMKIEMKEKFSNDFKKYLNYLKHKYQ